jgi:hypothetical protein
MFWERGGEMKAKRHEGPKKKENKKSLCCKIKNFNRS